MQFKTAQARVTDEQLQVIRKQSQIRAARLTRIREFYWWGREALEQELILRALPKVERFDSSRAGFETFICRVVRNEAASLIRRERAKQRCSKRPLSLDVNLGRKKQGTRGSRLVDPKANLLRQLDLVTDVQATCRAMPEHLFEVAQLLVEHEGNVTAVAQVLGMCRDEVRVCRDAIEARFASAGYFHAA